MKRAYYTLHWQKMFGMKSIEHRQLNVHITSSYYETSPDISLDTCVFVFQKL